MFSTILYQFEISKSYFNSLFRHTKDLTYKRQKLIKVLNIYRLVIGVYLWKYAFWNTDVVIRSKIPFAE